MSDGNRAETPSEYIDDLFDDPDWSPPPRTNRLTVVLAAALVAAAGFLGGVFAQQAYDSGTGAHATGPSVRGGGGVRVAGPGGAGATAQPTTAAAAPAVVGTIASISGSTLTVTNFAGAAVTVAVPPTAHVTTSGMGGLTVGATIAVVGTKGADGVVTAASITSKNT